MAEPFIESFVARWPDMDFNQHMRNGAFLGCSEDTRMRFLAANGWPMAEFMRLSLGPVVVEDKLTYRKELRLLEPFTVDMRLAGITADARRMRVRNQFFRTSDQALCAVVESVVLWFDLAARKPVAPPKALADLWLGLARTDDFQPME
jgi:acyl-CoA thioester hydrolase